MHHKTGQSDKDLLHVIKEIQASSLLKYKHFVSLAISQGKRYQFDKRNASSIFRHFTPFDS